MAERLMIYLSGGQTMTFNDAEDGTAHTISKGIDNGDVWVWLGGDGLKFHIRVRDIIAISVENDANG